jgi:hypothetical protein
MKTASLKEIKTELNRVHPARLLELCLQLAKYKKENKELLSYLLFDSYDEKAYIGSVKSQMDEQFKDANRSNVYLAKKSIRKILAATNKLIKFSGSQQTKLELLIYFCKKLRKSGIPLPLNSALGKLYWRQVQKAKVSLSTLHEDLQFDYSEEISQL